MTGAGSCAARGFNARGLTASTGPNAGLHYEQSRVFQRLRRGREIGRLRLVTEHKIPALFATEAFEPSAQRSMMFWPWAIRSSRRKLASSRLTDTGETGVAISGWLPSAGPCR